MSGWGSSPLARGLLARRASEPAHHGIIPARAGFTQTPSPRTTWAQDHPRSRGVYVFLTDKNHSTRGSSPLARGLPRRRGQHRGESGIIPARAGFTRSRARSGRSLPDHPRSRGVYTTAPSHLVSAIGSSPLARGLQPQREPASSGCRIIPARAGFTFLSSTGLLCPGDHPRSRGVYKPKNGSNDLSFGSSPLARGLRQPDPQQEQGAGIIPARAGFTLTPRMMKLWSRDHPRSRGVYLFSSSAVGAFLGSSPLARGLR